MEKRTSSFTAGVNINCTATMGNCMEGPQKTKNRATHDPVIPLLGTYPDKSIIQKDIHNPIFVCACSVASFLSNYF